ncbi:mannosyltransferase [Rhizodiscina lignyota]|uniref:GPI mannosyltransferase 2 n=1 Tax=Rhizodiscina lignyota TaxID=1504668 RepID=A0A9P4ILC7_9PEZI|nr:mannosyltransferase [Rhizodiscina lignyota]
MRPALLPSQKPRINLICLFVLWKIFLLAIAILSPGPGYDTSTQLLLIGDLGDGHSSPGESNFSEWSVSRLAAEKLTRWDGIYFASLAERGYIFEQGWAFSWGLTRLMSLFTKALSSDERPTIVIHALSGISLANLAHLLAVLVLYQLVLVIASHEPDGQHIAFLAAVLHVLSPAGLFLSAPNAESIFALLNFSGMLFYSFAWRAASKLVMSLNMLLAGLAFGLATVVRSNGLLSGAILAADFATTLWLFRRRWPTLSDLLVFCAIGISGLLTAAGFILPQAIAYQEYCIDAAESNRREWCNRTIPSIYSWVQEHYWNVGFLRYWTLSNLPLFLIAAPSIYLLFSTAIQCIRQASNYRAKTSSTAQKETPDVQQARARAVLCLYRFALPQALLAVLALTNFHVQIITRMASAYPVWYFALAQAITKKEKLVGGLKPELVVRWMVMYALIQGGLFASFLPPA